MGKGNNGRYLDSSQSMQRLFQHHFFSLLDKYFEPPPFPLDMRSNRKRRGLLALRGKSIVKPVGEVICIRKFYLPGIPIMWRHNGGFPSIHWKRRAKYKMATTIENDSDYFLQENPYPISTFHQLFDAERQGHYCKGTKMSNTYFYLKVS